jgi:hypothetical protein
MEFIHGAGGSSETVPTSSSSADSGVLTLSVGSVCEYVSAWEVGGIERIGGFGVDTQGNIADSTTSITGPALLRDSIALPAQIVCSTRKVKDVGYDYVKYAEQSAVIPPACVLSKRSCLRKLLTLFTQSKPESFMILVRKRGERLIFDRELRSPQPDYFGKSFEKLMTYPNAQHRHLKSYHTIIRHAGFLGDLPLIVCCETDARNGADEDVELKSKVRKKDKKIGGYEPLDKTVISNSRSREWTEKFIDYWGQMFFAHTAELYLGVHENGTVMCVDRWSFEEVRDRAFISGPSDFDCMTHIRKVAGVINWIRSQLVYCGDRNGRLFYENGQLKLELVATAEDALTAGLSNLSIGTSTHEPLSTEPRSSSSSSSRDRGKPKQRSTINDHKPNARIVDPTEIIIGKSAAKEPTQGQ